MTTRGAYITVCHDRLGRLSTTAGLTDSEDSYGYSLDATFRVLTGATDLPDDEDVNFNDVIDVLEQFTLRKLINYYSFYVDTSVGPRRESFSQLLAAVEKRVRHSIIAVDNTYSLGSFDRYDGDELAINWFELAEVF